MRPREYQQGYDTASMLKDLATPKRNPIIISNFGPLDLQHKPSEIAENESPRCRNAYIKRGWIEPRAGRTLLDNSSFDSTILFIGEFATSDNHIYAIIITQKSLYSSTNLVTFTRIPWRLSPNADPVPVVTVTSTSAIVTGTNTSFLSWTRAGDKFKCVADSDWSTIQSVNSNTQIILTANSPVSRTGVLFQIERYFGGSESELFWGATIADADYFVFSQGVDKLLYLNSSMDLVRELSSDAPAAKYGALFDDRVIVGNLPNYPTRLQRCASGVYNDWVGTGAGFTDLITDPEAITGLFVKLGVLILFKESSIWHVYRTGVATNPFEYKIKIPGVGKRYGGMINTGDSVIIIGSDNFYNYDARTDPEALGDKVKDYFFSNLNPDSSASDTIHGTIMRERDEVQIYFPSGTNTSPNLCWIYSPELRGFTSEWDLAATASGILEKLAPSLGSLVENLIGNGTSLYKLDPEAEDDDGTNFIFEWHSKDYKPKALKQIASYRVVVEYYCSSSATMKASLSGDGGSNFCSEMSVTLNASDENKLQRVFFDFIQSYTTARVRLRVLDGGAFNIVSVRAEAIELGEVNA
jgi:hypothetical protein